MKRLLEVCCGSWQSVVNATEGGAERIELCQGLSLDGLTPSIGLLKKVRERYPRLKIHVLIRPHEGGFVYSDDEVQVMIDDIHAALPFCDGIVSGALSADGEVDKAVTSLLIANSHGKPFTFHRAFDLCPNQYEALETLIRLECSRILTSGQAPTAKQGLDRLCHLCNQAAGRIIIMPGGGVNAENARQILDLTGTSEIHGSCSDGTHTTSADTVKQVLATIGG